jgi:hypothetical protein
VEPTDVRQSLGEDVGLQLRSDQRRIHEVQDGTAEDAIMLAAVRVRGACYTRRTAPR